MAFNEIGDIGSLSFDISKSVWHYFCNFALKYKELG